MTEYRTREDYCYRCGGLTLGDIVDNVGGYDHVKCHVCKWTASYPEEA